MFTGRVTAGRCAASRSRPERPLCTGPAQPLRIAPSPRKETSMAISHAFGERADLRADARQPRHLARQGRGARDGEEVRAGGLPRRRGSRPTCCRCRRRSRSPATPPSSASRGWPAVEAPTFADDEKTPRRPARSASARRSTTCSRCRRRRSTAATRRTSRCRAAPARSRMTGEAYLKHFALPNFFFHVTTTYALLRHNGVELGKIDFLGALPQAGAAA